MNSFLKNIKRIFGYVMALVMVATSPLQALAKEKVSTIESVELMEESLAGNNIPALTDLLSAEATEGVADVVCPDLADEIPAATPSHFERLLGSVSDEKIYWAIDGECLTLSAEKLSGYHQYKGDLPSDTVFSEESQVPWKNRGIEIIQFQVGSRKIQPLSTAYWFTGMTIRSIDFSGLDTDNTVNMSHMFSDSVCGKLDLGSLEAKNVKDMSYMFSGFTGRIKFQKINVENAENMEGMFCNYNPTTDMLEDHSLDLSMFDVPNVENMSRMFEGSNLTSLNLEHFDTTNVKDMSRMFCGCENLTELTCSYYFSTKNTEDLSEMFFGCGKLKDVSAIEFSFQNAVDVSSMFKNCGQLSNSFSITDASTAHLQTMEEMFSGCSNLGNVTIKDLDATEVTSMSSMFEKACSSKSVVSISNITTKDPLDLSEMFSDCSAATIRLKNCDFSGATTMNSMFKNAGKAGGSIEVMNIKSDAVTDMAKMFLDCKVETLDLSSLDTQSVTDMESMFEGCTSLTELNISGFSTEKVTTMESMFDSCKKLKEIDLESFDTQCVISMKQMFRYCESLEIIIVSKNFTVENVENGDQMFTFCTRLTGQNGTQYYQEERGKKYARIDTEETPGYFSEGSVSIVYVLNGGKNSPENPTKYRTLKDEIVLKAPTRTGYVFDGWYSDFDFKTKVTGIPRGSKGIKQFFAKWNVVLYTVKFNGNGSTSGSMNNQNRQYNDEKVLPVNTYKRTGYSFTGWNTKSDGTGKSYADKSNKNIRSTAGTTTLYAQWEQKAYKITYELNGGKNSSKNPEEYTITAADFALENPTKTGYTFDGWYSDSGFKTKVSTVRKGSTGSKTFYAKWIQNKYTIAFKANGGTGTMDSVKVSYSTKKVLPANTFKKTGYTFSGWNTKADGSGKAYNNKETVSKLSSKNGATVTLYAQWKVTKYTIAFNANGGKGSMSSLAKISYSTKKVLPANTLTRTGYTFTGWNTKADGSGTSYTDRATVSKLTAKGDTTVTLYAQWKQHKYTIAFKANGGTGTMDSVKVSYSTKKVLPANTFKRTGCTFTGWNTKADGSGKAYSNKETVSKLTSKEGATVTLYAQWIMKEGYEPYNGEHIKNGGLYILKETGNYQIYFDDLDLTQQMKVYSSDKNVAEAFFNAGSFEMYGEYGCLSLYAYRGGEAEITLKKTGSSKVIYSFSVLVPERTEIIANTYDCEERLGYIQIKNGDVINTRSYSISISLPNMVEKDVEVQAQCNGQSPDVRFSRNGDELLFVDVGLSIGKTRISISSKAQPDLKLSFSVIREEPSVAYPVNGKKYELTGLGKYYVHLDVLDGTKGLEVTSSNKNCVSAGFNWDYSCLFLTAHTEGEAKISIRRSGSKEVIFKFTVTVPKQTELKLETVDATKRRGYVEIKNNDVLYSRGSCFCIYVKNVTMEDLEISTDSLNYGISQYLADYFSDVMFPEVLVRGQPGEEVTMSLSSKSDPGLRSTFKVIFK